MNRMYRVTFPGLYGAGTPGHTNATARQGHYVSAATPAAAGAIARVRAGFHEQTCADVQLGVHGAPERVQLSAADATPLLAGDREYPAGPCAACGNRIAHVDDPGHEDLLHVGTYAQTPEGDVIVCSHPACTEASDGRVWTCACGVTNVGDHDTCVECSAAVNGDDEGIRVRVDNDPASDDSLAALVAMSVDAPMTPSEVASVRALAPGDSLTFGGGAQARFRITRIA